MATTNQISGVPGSSGTSTNTGTPQPDSNVLYDYTGGKIFTQFVPNQDIISNIVQDVTATMWSSEMGGTLYHFYTSSTQVSASGDYFYNIYQTGSSDVTAEIQFAMAFGDINGSGSVEINEGGGDTGLTPSRAIYSQYRNVLLAGTTEQFTLADGTAMTRFYAITYQRERYKERVDPGNWELWLSGSQGKRVLVDDYTGLTNSATAEAGQVFNVLSGSFNDGLYTSGSSYVYAGLFYPEHGLMLINADYVSGSVGVAVSSAEQATPSTNNISKLLNSMNLAGTNGTDYGFTARNIQKVTSTYYFVRAKNFEYNFSNNPSFTTGSNGQLRHEEMFENPTVYITTIGLYNVNNELLAVAKVSQPIKKAFDREATIRVKIDF